MLHILLVGDIRPGATTLYNGYEYEVLNLADHKTQRGQDTTLITWRTKCRNCSEPMEFTTGVHRARMRSICPKCYSKKGPDKKPKRVPDSRDKTREWESQYRPHVGHPDLVSIRLAVEALGPVPSSLGRRTCHKTLYAPALLREAAADFAHFTLEEVRFGLELALYERWVRWGVVGRYANRTPRKGLVLCSIDRHGVPIPDATAKKAPDKFSETDDNGVFD